MDNNKFESLADALEGSYEKSLDNIPEPLRTRVKEVFDLISWSACDEDGRRHLARQWDQKNDPSNEGENLIAWYDGTIDAATWREHGGITPIEAATLLCEIDPHDGRLDPALISNLETDSTDFKRLLRSFEDAASADPQIRRSLLQWRSVAKERRLKVHSWHDKYEAAMEARSQTAVIDASIQLDSPEFLASFSEYISNGESIDWGYWVGKMPTLVILHASRLISGLDPDKFESLTARPTKNDTTKWTANAKRIERLATAQGVISKTSSDWLIWADAHELYVHNSFRFAVETQLALLEASATAADLPPELAPQHREAIEQDPKSALWNLADATAESLRKGDLEVSLNKVMDELCTTKVIKANANLLKGQKGAITRSWFLQKSRLIGWKDPKFRKQTSSQ